VVDISYLSVVLRIKTAWKKRAAFVGGGLIDWWVHFAQNNNFISQKITFGSYVRFWWHESKYPSVQYFHRRSIFSKIYLSVQHLDSVCILMQTEASILPCKNYIERVFWVKYNFPFNILIQCAFWCSVHYQQSIGRITTANGIHSSIERRGW